jgi:hypothetical protein
VLRYALLLASLAVAALLLMPERADARIFLNKGVTGAHIGMTKAHVKANLGAPKRIKRRVSDFGPLVEYRYGRLKVVFADGGRRVTWLATTRKRERTGKGIGVGSARADVETLVPGVVCANLGTVGTCDVGDTDTAGSRITTFWLNDNDVVSRVQIYVVFE